MRLHGDRSNLYRHLCPHCGRKFTTTAHMAGHIRAEHTGEKPYKCEPCGIGMPFVIPPLIYGKIDCKW